MSGGIILTTKPRSRYDLQMEASGIVSEPYSRAHFGSSSLLTSQKLEGALCGVKVGDVLTGVVVGLATNAATLTLAKVAAYTTGGTLVASSANSAANYDSGAGALKTLAFSAPYTVTSDSALYASLLTVGTTPPTLMRDVNQAYMEGIGSGTPLFVTQTGQADLPASATFSEQTISLWIGFY